MLVSVGGGTAPRWPGDGRELFYLAPDGKMMAVDVIAGPTSTSGRRPRFFRRCPAQSSAMLPRTANAFSLSRRLARAHLCRLRWC